MLKATGASRTTGDVRSHALDLVEITPEQHARLRGEACARCGHRDGLRRAGYAYTISEGAGRLGWAVKVCESCERAGART